MTCTSASTGSFLRKGILSSPHASKSCLAATPINRQTTLTTTSRATWKTLDSPRITLVLKSGTVTVGSPKGIDKWVPTGAAQFYLLAFNSANHHFTRQPRFFQAPG